MLIGPPARSAWREQRDPYVVYKLVVLLSPVQTFMTPQQVLLERGQFSFIGDLAEVSSVRGSWSERWLMLE